MRELDAILTRYEQLKEAGISAVLATVVHVEGSSYRRAGARMLVDEYGNITGAISGGCLEGDALRKALHALHQQKNKLVTYDTSSEDDAQIGAQLGCNGIIQVLFEPLQEADPLNPCELLKYVLNKKAPAAIVIQFSLNKQQEQRGTTLLISADSEVLGKKPEKEIFEHIMEQARNSWKNNKAFFVEYLSGREPQHLFLQVYQPPVQLVVVGAGNDAQVLAQQAALLGWKVVVVDGRPTHANKDRFSGSCQVIVSNPEETLKKIQPDEYSCFVLMSHNYNYDLAVLKLLLKEKSIPYIGILGPLKKYQKMLREEGMEMDRKTASKIYAPVGLDLGAETPAEIGLSILAEIQAVLTGRNARFLREKASPIHEKKESEFMQIQI